MLRSISLACSCRHFARSWVRFRVLWPQRRRPLVAGQAYGNGTTWVLPGHGAGLISRIMLLADTESPPGMRGVSREASQRGNPPVEAQSSRGV